MAQRIFGPGCSGFLPEEKAVQWREDAAIGFASWGRHPSGQTPRELKSLQAPL